MIRPIPNVENEKGFGRARHPVEVELVTPGALASRMNYAYEILYFCFLANSFYARWFPEDLPRYHPEDLATLLVRIGSALPTIELLNTDRDYALTLIRAAAANSFGLDLPNGDSYWRRLGWVMAKQYPEAVTTAAEIISRTGDARAVTLAKQRIDTLLTTTEHRSSWDRDRELSQLVRTIDRFSAEESYRARMRIKARFGEDWKMQSH